MTRHVPTLATVCLVGCTQYDLREGGVNGSGGADNAHPAIEVSPECITFDTIDIVRDDPPGMGTVTIENVGEDTLHIEDVYLADGKTAYTFQFGQMAYSLRPGDTTEFDVVYDPDQPFDHPDTIIVSSDDPETPTAEVCVNGDALAPKIEIDPIEYSFGDKPVGCPSVRDIAIRNVGNSDLVIDDIPAYTFSSSELMLHPGVDYLKEPKNTYLFPVTIPSGEQITMQVVYMPLDEYPDTATMRVHSNDPYTPSAVATQDGGTTGAEDQTDLFEQPAQPMTDIVFVVDNSCSMAEEQESLADNFSVFMYGLALTDADYQIGVITTDQNEFRGPIITNETLDPVTKFTDQATPGTSGSGFERGLQMLYECLQAGGDCSPEAEFMRDGALFAGVYVSDEPDQSTLSAKSYVEQIWDLKGGDTDLVRLHAIAGDIPDGCATAGAGYGYDTAVSLTDGTYLSICAKDWGAYMAVLAEGSVADLSTFKLSRDPVEETITVYVDNLLTEEGWWYTGHVDEGGTNGVKFGDEDVPQGGAEIRVEYVVRGDCEQ
jgi:hypothetical protein